MSRQTLEAHYRPNWKLAQAQGLSGYNCGYAPQRGEGSFDQHQKELVWQTLAGAGIGPTTRVLDVGCGIGGPARWIVERFAPRQLIGLEYCWSSVHAAARAIGKPSQQHACFVQADAHQLPLADGSIDVILNLESALHYADKRRFLSECRRVLAPGGLLCLGDITTPRQRSLGMAMLQGLGAMFKSTAMLWSAEDYRSAFAGVGLELRQHQQASLHVADSLADGLDEIRRRGWKAARGFRMRFYYLIFLEWLLRSGRLHYDLFTLARLAEGANAGV